MLELKNISKTYITGELKQDALKDVSITFRDNEFVSILGASGSGKTTLLNIVGGLDRYDSGDLVINGISTKQYKDRDWDTYRNHSIGFVFQSYNLIPHQTVLFNVELALTIGGISRGERRSRAKKALEEVGLGDQLHKRPNQMSGGQMQRVAIARALVNDPDILLADEPTGALDTETSLQVMELLKRVAKDKLVVMVTHNPELAQQYSTRIVRLKDGQITGDSDPYDPEKERQEKAEEKGEVRKTGKAKMSFLTSLSLSFNNLRTKKGRTVLTAFAGSIGIIGIALILALSSGVNQYIDDIQKETMTSYPITISSQAVDMSGILGMRNSMVESMREEEDRPQRSGVFADYRELETSEAMMDSIKENNLTEFKKYLDDPKSEIREYLGENGVIYSYGVQFKVFSRNADGDLISSDASPEDTGSDTMMSQTPMAGMQRMNSLLTGNSAGAENFSQLLPGKGGEAVSRIVTDSYDMVYGDWPQAYDEVLLVLNSRGAIPAETLYQLGMLTEEEYDEIEEDIKNGKEAKEHFWDYEDICSHTFYLLPSCDQYEEEEDGTFTYVGDQLLRVEPLLEDGVELKITGVIRPKEGAENTNISTAVAYTSLLTDRLIRHANESAVVLAQEENEKVNVLNGMEFEAADDDAKEEAAKEYISNLGVSDKASFYSLVMYYASQNTEKEGEQPAAEEAAQGGDSMGEATQEEGSPEEMIQGEMPQDGMLQGGMSASMMQNGMSQGGMDEASMAAALDRWLQETPDRELLLSAYDQYLGGYSLKDNLEAFGKVSYDAPSSISMYTDSFEDKEEISRCIEEYNQGVKEQNAITYTDYVALLTGSVTTIINVISYVLIAFVAVSLIVSSIMIGIITHISVLERTKEIGILRAMGASKRNVSQVFNAETVIIGLLSGAIGVGVTMLLTVPITSLLQSLLSSDALAAFLPIPAAVLLVVLSVGITVLAGLLPAKKAAKCDPVIALRTE